MCGVCVASRAKPFGKTLSRRALLAAAMPEHRGVRLQQDVDGGDRGLRGREDGLPIVLHADHGPAVLLRVLFQRGREVTVFDVRQSARGTVGKFARRVVVQHEQLEPRAAAALRVFQHLLVAHGVAERGDGPAADVLVDADGLVALVVIEVQLRQAHEHRLAVAQFELRLHAAADDLLRRDAIGLLRPHAHELDAAAGDDEVLEAVRAQIGEHFEHRLIGHVEEALAGLRMFRGGDPVLDDLRKLVGGHAGVRGHEEFHEPVVAAFERRFHIALEQRGERFLGLPLGMLRRERLHAVRPRSKTGPAPAARTRACRRCRTRRCVRGRARSPASRVSSPSSTKSMMDCLALPSFHEGKRVGGASNGCGESQRASERGGEEVLSAQWFSSIRSPFR